MASYSFFPQGTQLDNDEIVDLQVNVGDNLGLISILDTSGLDANLQSITLRLEADSTEVDLSDTPTEFFETTFPDVTVVVEDNSDEVFASLVAERGGEPGAIPNTVNVVVESEATVLDGLVNDGAPDLRLTVLEATDANGNDVTDLFEPANQAIDLQPSPQVQEILGTDKNDPIIGTSQNDIIQGKEGNDSIGDGEGNDRSFGGEGNDLFVDGAGDDTIIGGAGNDFFAGVTPGIAGDDFIDLGTGNDFALGGAGDDTYVLNRDSGVILIRDFTPGEDRFALGDNLTKDDLNFARLDNNSSFDGGTSISDADTGELIAFADSATVEALSNAEFVSVEDVSSAGNSPTTVEESPEPIQVESLPAQSGEIFGTPNSDLLVGDDETNLIIAGDEGDVISSGGGDDLVFGEAGNDVINGEAGNDLLNGGADSDVLNGDEGADTLLGEGGNNVISGGHGNDLLVGGDGNDALFGDEGHDTFVFASGEGVDIVFDFEPEKDAIALTSGSSYDSLQIEYNAQGNYTNISDETGELIATLIGVEADQLTESNFTVGNEDEGLSQEPYSNLIVFGDSLSDTGNVFNATEGSVPPSPLYDDRRFSNGDLIVDAIAESLELPENESFQLGGNNYAFGAAQTGEGTSEYGFLLPEPIDVPNIGDQIDLYLADRTPTQSDLFYIYGGTNDFIDPLLRGETLPTSEEIVGNITTHITELAEAGAHTFVVPNLPPLGDIPLLDLPLFSEQPEATAILNNVTVEFNQLLDTELDAIAESLDIEIIEPDIYHIATEIQNNPSDFGLTNTIDAFFDRIEPIDDTSDLSVTGNPEEFFFWDVFHPTAATTEIIAREAVVSEFGVAAQANLEAHGEFTSVFGTLEADTLEVTGTKNLVFAGFGNDTVNVSHANNRIYGNSGDDAFFLGTGDYVVGGEGSDQFWVADTELPDTANRIADFELDSDVIGFNNLGTSFENLTLTQDGSNTLIALEEKTVAILTNVDANSLDAGNFAFN